MKTKRGDMRVAQAWVELKTRDPEAVSALGVARAYLPEGGTLRELRRVRCIELEGPLPGRAELLDLLHRSTQFYNPHKERIALRIEPSDPAPVPAGAQVVLVTERGATARPAAERWWLHETGERIGVREGVAWILGFEPGTDAAAGASGLAVLRDRRHGLLCNPHSQEHRQSDAAVPLPWIEGGAVPDEED
jgi:hypothetical protein